MDSGALCRHPRTRQMQSRNPRHSVASDDIGDRSNGASDLWAAEQRGTELQGRALLKLEMLGCGERPEPDPAVRVVDGGPALPCCCALQPTQRTTLGAGRVWHDPCRRFICTSRLRLGWIFGDVHRSFFAGWDVAGRVFGVVVPSLEAHSEAIREYEAKSVSPIVVSMECSRREVGAQPADTREK